MGKKNIKNIIVFTSHKKNILKPFNEVIEVLKKYSVNVFLTRENAQYLNVKEYMMIDDRNIKKTDLIISLGGDGTFLRAARLAVDHGIYIMGINLCKLGFLTEISRKDIKLSFKKLFGMKFKVQKKMLINAAVFDTRGNNLFNADALNDVVIYKGSFNHLLDIKTYINEKYAASFVSDWLIISTPTGSTAYSLSAGGPIISPKVECILINALCPHTLSARPVVISPEETIRINEKRAPSVEVIIDGQTVYKLKRNAYINIRKSLKYAHIISLFDDFYSVVRSKLKWVD